MSELIDRSARVSTLELFFDLVFVLGFTQCTTLMAAQPTWTGIGRGMLVLAMLWWSWAGYAWLTSVVEPEEGSVRIAMLAAMAGLLVVALSAPQAFGDRAFVFAVAYGVVRMGHIALFLIASRDVVGLRRSVSSLGTSTFIAVGLLLGASFLGGPAQAVLWGIAIMLDWGGPAVFGVDGWRLVPAHFAERHNLVIILALGESIVALGAGADVEPDRPGDRCRRPRDRPRVGAVVDLLRCGRTRHRTATDTGGGRTRAQRSRSGLVLLSALSDGRRDRARRARAP